MRYSLASAKLVENLFEGNRFAALALGDRLKKHFPGFRVDRKGFIPFLKKDRNCSTFREFGLVQLDPTVNDSTRSNSHELSIRQSATYSRGLTAHASAARPATRRAVEPGAHERTGPSPLHALVGRRELERELLGVFDGPDREVDIEGRPIEMILARPLDLRDLADGSVRKPREVFERYEQFPPSEVEPEAVPRDVRDLNFRSTGSMLL